MKIWIVQASRGTYDDHESWPVCAFFAKAAATKWIRANNPAYLAQLARDEADTREFRDQSLEFFRTGCLGLTALAKEKAYTKLVVSFAGKNIEAHAKGHGYQLRADTIELLGLPSNT